MDWTRLVVVGASLAAAIGCASYQPAGPARVARPLPPDLQQYYGYPPGPITALVCEREQHPAYAVKRVTLTVAGSAAPIRITWYAPADHARRPLILISPIKGSNTLIVDGCARVFATAGYQAAIVARARLDFDPAGPVAQVEEFLRHDVIAHRQALDWLLTQPGIDPERVAAFGISYGAIITAPLAAVDPRVKLAVLDLAGGPLAGVMRFSAEHSLRRDWRRSRRDHDLTNRQLYQALQTAIRTDPVKLAPYIGRDRVLMLIARFDHSVPTRYQLALWQALGKPRADFVPFGHYTAILALPAHRFHVLQFFAENFAPFAPGATAGPSQALNQPPATPGPRAD